MTDIEITHAEWQQFCENFTRQHHGWLVNMRQLDTRELGPDKATKSALTLFPDDAPLQEVREGREDDHVDLMVTAGEGKDERSLLIEDAIALFQRKTGNAHMGLRVDCSNGTTTLVEFRSAAEPESLNGLTESER
jgi:hypothetical protein